ncbi:MULTISPECIES: hypothetical protein [Nocardioides]|uniref:Uncharacterized protein n=1 Tax=Nocardioides vastitatis TaxID=2568655 RepID=A0ABW0ZBB0_9ACTN|nr:hypothetical protein [Nocardioides sp.]
MIVLASVIGVWIALAAALTFCLAHAASRTFDVETDAPAPALR